MLNQVLSIILSIVMFIPNMLFSGGIITSIKELFNKNNLVSMTKEFYYVDGLLNSKYVDQDGNEIEVEIPDDSEDAHTRADATLPSAYDTRDDNVVTSVKNQGGTGCCWAFSVSSVLESSLIKHEYATKDNIDISEAHLAWFTNRSYNANQTDNIGRDGLYVTSPFVTGGSWEVASCSLSSWSGATTESKYPFNSATTSEMEFAQSEKYASDYTLTSALDYSSATRDEIKQAVIDNGSVSTSYYHNSSNYKNSTLGYCYYQNVQTGTNHAVTIVGWNDDFPASYFSKTPAANGAWLIKNSWGSAWGASGYFWLSYYDTSVKSFGVFNIEPSGKYDNNYQYDGFGGFSGYGYQSSTNYGGNVFTAERHELIGGAGFRTHTANQSCEISLYKNLTSATKPSSGTLLEKKTVNCKFRGYHTIDFDNSYEIQQGENFSVVVKYTVSSGTAFVPCEGENSSDFYGDGSTRQYSYSESGQSFLSYNNNVWIDMKTTGNNNIPIKAFTKNYKEQISLKDTATVSLEEGNLITGIYPGSVTPAQLKTMLVGNNFISDAKLKTGSQIRLYGADGKLSDTGTVVVFGDTDCDGNADGQDAFIVSMIMLGMLHDTDIDAARMRAADYNNDGSINDLDFNLIFNSGLHIDSDSPPV